MLNIRIFYLMTLFVLLKLIIINGVLYVKSEIMFSANRFIQKN